MKIGDAYLNIQAKIGDYVKNVTKAKSSFADFSGSVQKNSQQMQTVMASLAVVTGSILLPMKRLIQQGVVYGTNLDKLRRITGSTTEELAGLQYAVESYHGSAESLQSGLMRLSRAMYDYGVRGLATYGETFKSMGIEVVNARGELRSVTDVFKDMAGYVESANNITKVTGELMTVLGRGAIALVPILKKGASAFEAQAVEAKRLGLTLSNETAAALEDLGTQQAEVESAWKSLGSMMALQVAPVLTELNRLLKELIGWFTRLPKWVKYLIVWIPLLTASMSGLLAAMLGMVLVLPKLSAGWTILAGKLSGAWTILTSRMAIAGVSATGMKTAMVAAAAGTKTALLGLGAVLGPAVLLGGTIALIMYMDKLKKEILAVGEAALENSRIFRKNVKVYGDHLFELKKLSDQGFGDMAVSAKLSGKIVTKTVDEMLNWLRNIDPVALKLLKLDIDVEGAKAAASKMLEDQKDMAEAQFDYLVNTNQISKEAQIKHWQSVLEAMRVAGKKETVEYLQTKTKIWKIRQELTEQIREEAEKQAEIEIAAREKLTGWIETHEQKRIQAREAFALEVIKVNQGQFAYERELARRSFQDRQNDLVDLTAAQDMFTLEMAEIERRETEAQDIELGKRLENQWEAVQKSNQFSVQESIDYLKVLRSQTKEGSDLWKKFTDRIEALNKASADASRKHWDQFVNATRASVSNWLASFMEGGMKIKEALKGVWDDIKRAFYKMVSDMVARWAVLQALRMIGMPVPVGFGEGGVITGSEQMKRKALAAGGAGFQDTVLIGEAGPEKITTGPQLAQLDPGDNVVPVEKMMSLMRGEVGHGNIVQGATSMPMPDKSGSIQTVNQNLTVSADLTGSMLSVNDTNVAMAFYERVLLPAIEMLGYQQVTA